MIKGDNMFGFLNGWKMVLAWLLTQVPQISDYPGLLGAIQEAITHGNRQTFTNLAIQILMAVGAIHRVQKNLKKDA